MVRRITLLALATSLAACYAYAPVTVDPSLVGHAVRVELSDQGRVAATPRVGSGVEWVEGLLSTVSDSGFDIALEKVSRREFGETTWNGETLPLRTADVTRIRERRISRSRTAGAVTALSVVSFAVLYWIATASGLLSGGPGGPPVDPP